MRLLGPRKGPLDEFDSAVASRFSPASPDDNVDVAERLGTPVEPTRSFDDDEPGRRVPLGTILAGARAITVEQLHDALALQSASGQRLGEILVRTAGLREGTLLEALAEQLDLTVVDLGERAPDENAIAHMSEDDARRLVALPLRESNGVYEVVVADPVAPELTERLREILGGSVHLVLAPASDIGRAIERSYRATARVGDVVRAFEELKSARTQEEQVERPVVDANAPIVQVVDVILQQAVRDRASDVHIEPRADRVRIRNRIDGALHEVVSLPAEMAPSLVSRIKIMAEMNIVERRRPQDGQFAVTVEGRDLDVRVSTTSTVFGEKAVLRLLDKSRAMLQLGQLGMPKATEARFKELVRSPYGMVICAGPTGSGKTTTLYATLSEISRDDINITTIEDPVEYVFEDITQIQINEQAGITFADGLRSILRQDPDAILVGEIRDVETARIAVQSALTGHFVMSSLHATDSVAALHRFLDMGIEPFLIASSLLGVVAQRLVRRVCPHCVMPYEPTIEELAFYERAGGPPRASFAKGSGCNFCSHTGYLDRIGVFEVLQITEHVRRLILENAPNDELRSVAYKQGMRTLANEAATLAAAGVTTIDEILRTMFVFDTGG